jgi:hypothetical protein
MPSVNALTTRRTPQSPVLRHEVIEPEHGELERGRRVAALLYALGYSQL